MAEQVRGPLEKFVYWQQCTAVMQREALIFLYLWNYFS